MSTETVTAADLLRYVRANAKLLAIDLADGQAERVADHLSRTAAMAQLLEKVPLAAGIEPAALFCPAPFPADDDPTARP